MGAWGLLARRGELSAASEDVFFDSLPGDRMRCLTTAAFLPSELPVLPAVYGQGSYVLVALTVVVAFGSSGRVSLTGLRACPRLASNVQLRTDSDQGNPTV